MWSLLGKIGMFLSDAGADKVPIYNTETGEWAGSYEWLNKLFGVLNPILYAIMAIVGAAGAIYAIVLGVNLARADEQAKRDEAKKRLITVLIAVGVTIALVLFFTKLFPLILGSFMKDVAVAPSTSVD